MKEYQEKEYTSVKLILSKHEYDLFYDEKNTVERVLRVRLVCPKTKDEKWKIIENDKTVQIVAGTNFSKKEREFLRTANGFNFLIAQYKNTNFTVSKFKSELKDYLNKQPAQK